MTTASAARTTDARPTSPDLLSRQINAERLVLLAWSRAILLQLAHPLVAAGVHEHSGFRASPRAAAVRLHHTVKSMLALTFGDDQARGQAVEGIRSIHRRVNGRLPVAAGIFPEGTAYSAEDPALLLWVHATLLESVPLVYSLLVHPLTEADHDAYCVEAAPIAVALGAREDDVPRTRRSLQAYISSTYESGAIAVSGQARELAEAIMHPPGGMLVAPATWLNELLTVGLLPEHVRAQYGFEWSPTRERALGLTMRGIRSLRRALPRQLAWWRDARRLPAGQSAGTSAAVPASHDRSRPQR